MAEKRKSDAVTVESDEEKQVRSEVARCEEVGNELVQTGLKLLLNAEQMKDKLGKPQERPTKKVDWKPILRRPKAIAAAERQSEKTNNSGTSLFGVPICSPRFLRHTLQHCLYSGHSYQPLVKVVHCALNGVQADRLRFINFRQRL